MNLEVKVNLTKYMWWDGTTGGAVKDGKFLYLVSKPFIPEVGDYDSILCYPEVPSDKSKNWEVTQGAQAGLDDAEIDAISAMIDRAVPSVSGGGGGGGITDLRVSIADRGIAFTDENGAKKVLPFGELKATPMEYYFDATCYDTVKAAYLHDVKVNVEYVIPFGTIPLRGRTHFMELNATTNRLSVSEKNLRGTLRAYGAFRFSPSVKSDMSLDLMWYYRRLGSSEGWSLVYKATVSRTATQTTAALTWPSSSAYYNLPDYPVELEARLKFTNIGTGINWSAIPFLNDVNDGLKVSLFREPNYQYQT